MVLRSPGIAYREVDATVYPASVDSSIVGILGFADKGPENEAVLITTAEQLIRVFGEPNDNLYGQGLLAALEILEATNRIYFVRAASGTTEASATVPFGVCPYITFTPTFNNYFGYATSAPALYLKVNLLKNNQSVYSNIFTIPATTSNEITYAASINALQAVIGDGTAKADLVGIEQDPIDNSVHLYGVVAGSEYALYVSAASGYNSATNDLVIVSGVNLFLPSSLEFASGNAVLGAGGSPASAASGIGLTLNSNCVNYLVKALYGGPGYNLGRSLKTGEVTGLSIEVDNVAGHLFNIYVNDKGYVNETFLAGFKGDTRFIEDTINETNSQTPIKSEFIKASFEGSSVTALTIEKLTSNAQEMTSLFGDLVASTILVSSYNTTGSIYPAAVFTNSGVNPRFVKLLPGTYSMLGGTNGIGFDDDASNSLKTVLVGDPAQKSGMYALDDDNLNISMAIIPGVHDSAVQNSLITLAESSQNFIAAVSPPFGAGSVQNAVNWINGKGTIGDRKAAINNSYVAVYWPHVQIFDTFSEKDIWIDPAIYAIRQMAFTDSVSFPWFAPAGFNRGRLSKPLDTEEILSQGDRDTLYENNINPVVKFIPEGITIFGQKTAKRLPSATDRVNVRRLMIYLRKVLLRSTRSYIFEPNDALTWESIKNLVESILAEIASERGIAEYRVLCDSTVNTPLRVSRRELWCKIILRPVEAAEYIIFEVNLTNNTASSGA